MKAFNSILMTALFTASAQAGTVLYTDSTAFFSSPTWTGAIAGSAVTENFVASGGLHNFTGNEEFSSNSYTYGSGSQQNAVTFARTDVGNILVDTSNESGGFLSSDSPGSSKYLYVPANGGGDAIDITFSQPISSFGFRIGDFGDPSLGWSSLRIRSRDALNSSFTDLVFEQYVNVFNTNGDNTFNALNLPNDESVITGDKSWFFIGWTFESPINQISLLQEDDDSNDSWGVDTVSFTTVPEPSAALLGVFGVLTLLRRRRP
jgi:hypothetical protein